MGERQRAIERRIAARLRYQLAEAEADATQAKEEVQRAESKRRQARELAIKRGAIDAPSASADQPAKSGDQQKGFWETFFAPVTENASKLAATLFTAGGLTSLVVVTGAAISWTRFHGAELPATQAVNELPRSELIVIGAQTLVVAVALGALATILAYMLESGGRPSRQIARGLMLLAALEATIIVVLGAGSVPWGVAAGLVLACGLCGALALTYTAKASLAGSRPDLEPTDKERRFATLGEPYAERAQPPKRFFLTWLGRGVLIAICLIVILLSGLLLWEWWVMLAMAAAFLLTGATFKIARTTGPRFAWYGVSVFFSVVALAAVIGVLTLLDDPQVQPAALIRKMDGPSEGLQGLYITRNDNDVVLGSVAVGGCGAENVSDGSGRIVYVPKADVVALAIGPLQGVNNAAPRAPEMLADLIATRPPEQATRSASESKGSTVKRKTMASAEKPARSVEAVPAVREEPRIDRIKPRRATPGETVVVTGKSFGKQPGTVSIGGLVVRPKTWTGERVTFRVPAEASTGRVRVICSSGRVLVVQHPPVAVAVAVPVGRTSRRFRLSATGSKDRDGYIAGYEWSVVRTTPSSRTKPRPKRPTEPRTQVDLPRGTGSATFKLTVVDDDGLEDSAQVRAGGIIDVVLQGAALFCFDCRQLSDSGVGIVQRLRSAAATAKRVRIEGHTDFRGSDAYNNVLACDRALAVKRALTGGQPRPRRTVTALGFGESQPIATNNTAAGRRRNRRVRITIIRQTDTPAKPTPGGIPCTRISQP